MAVGSMWMREMRNRGAWGVCLRVNGDLDVDGRDDAIIEDDKLAFRDSRPQEKAHYIHMLAKPRLDQQTVCVIS